jgi:DNA-binding NtrC family response regulator
VSQPTNQTLTREESPRRRQRPQMIPALVIAWSRDEPDRLGEVLLPPPGQWVELGRGEARPGDPPRVEPVRQRPGANDPTGPLTCPYLSHRQLRLRATGHRLEVERLGRRAMQHSGRAVDGATREPGDTLELDGELLLLCALRPERYPRPRVGGVGGHRFGEADAAGIVGEGPAAWRLRGELAFVASGSAHLMVQGPSGSGKELIARGVHRLSGAGGPLISRNAATLPPGLVDAELFGNIRDYPNPGMAARPGLVGQADGGVLFLDEFAEMPQEVQVHLLRVLDDGEYSRLGEAAPRRARFRLIAATNRPDSALRDDVRARMPLRITAPGLDARREDIPLLIRHLLLRRADQDPDLLEPFFDGDHPRLTPRLVDALLRHSYTTHVRELDALLLAAMMAAPSDEPVLDRAPGMALKLAADKPAQPAPSEVVDDPDAIPPEVIQACLDKHNGVQSKVWRELGLKSRFVLIRLIKKHGLRVTRQS